MSLIEFLLTIGCNIFTRLILFMPGTGALLRDTITDNPQMVCPPILDEAVQGGFVNRILACSFDKTNCSYLRYGFIQSITVSSLPKFGGFQTNSFNKENGLGYVFDSGVLNGHSSFRISVPASFYDDIKYFDIYITMAYFGKLYYEMVDTMNILYNPVYILYKRFSQDYWVVSNLRFSFPSRGFNFELLGYLFDGLKGFDDICIYQVCKIGFEFNNTSSQCEDINECALSTTNNCTVNATCNNFNGGYNCKCKSGFNTNNGGVELHTNLCLDINECASSNKNNCSENALCNNLVGGYNCVCKNGFNTSNNGPETTDNRCLGNPCSMKPNGIYLNRDIFTFLSCTSQQASFVNCSVNQMFDPAYNKCMDVRNYSLDNFCIGKSNNFNYRNPWNCYSYITCNDYVSTEWPCQTTLVYNFKTNACEYADSFECVYITTTESVFKNSQTSTIFQRSTLLLSSSVISLDTLSTANEITPITTLVSSSASQISKAHTSDNEDSHTPTVFPPSILMISSSSYNLNSLLTAYEPTTVSSYTSTVTTSQISIAHTSDIEDSHTSTVFQPSIFMISSSNYNLNSFLTVYEPTTVSSYTSTVTTSQISIEWTVWSECSKTCGEGTKVRYSYNVVPNSEFENCNLAKCPVHGIWGDWSNSKCLITCGEENISLVRSCDIPLYNGRSCMGMNNYIQDCSLNTVCPVNGKWSMWSLWSLCNQPCEGGIQSRFRICSVPKYGGRPCNGNSSETIYCSLKNCKKVDVDLRVLFDEDFNLPPFEIKDRIEKAISNVYKSLKRTADFKILLRSIRNVNP